MKNKIWSQHIISAILSCLLAISAIGNLITGYELPVGDLWKIYLWSALFAFVSSVLLRFRYGGRIMIFLTTFALLVLWGREAFRKQILEQVQYLCYAISSHYNDVYDWPIWGSPTAKDASKPLILWSALVAANVNVYICRRKHIIIAIIPAILPLVLCLLTTDKVPDVHYLYLLILGISVLLLSDWTRRKQPAQGMKVILRSALSIAISLALLFVLNPQEKYVNHAGKLQKEVVQWFQEFQDKAESVANGSPITSPVSEKLNLRTVGPKSKISHSVMRVTSPIGGTIYLRGRDYDQYTGTGWEASSGRNEELTSGGSFLGELTIVTYGVRNILYVPYYTTNEITLVGGALDNDENLQRYSYYLSRSGSGNSESPNSQYTNLPDNAASWAKKLIKDVIGENLSNSEKVLRIQNYVRDSATYDLSTSCMDPEYSDFAQWFLEDSDSGYCVHFATATTVLLRAAGIPARYVEGYMVSCTADSDVVVTNQEAHAWAEYYDSSTCTWRVLEATPNDLENENTEPAVTIPHTEPVSEKPGEEPENAALETSIPEAIPTIPNNDQEEVPDKSNDPSGNIISQDKEKEPFSFPPWIKTVFKWLILAVCVPIQAYLRIYWKQTLWNSGRPNERTLSRWRQTCSLAKLLKQPYPEELNNLAQKAKFSQHRIQPEELQQFEDYRSSLIERINEKAWYHQIIAKWIFAID